MLCRAALEQDCEIRELTYSVNATLHNLVRADSFGLNESLFCIRQFIYHSFSSSSLPGATTRHATSRDEERGPWEQGCLTCWEVNGGDT